MANKALIVGLGNPGREYVGNRHNVGFQCLDHFAKAHSLAFTRRQADALIADGTIAETRVVLAKPQRYMNLSGAPVAALARFFQIEPERLIVVYDDMDLPLGTLRIRPEGGHGGHNGIRSLLQSFGPQPFARIRVGIARPPGRMDPAAYVLQDFGRDEAPFVAEVYPRVAAALTTWLTDGLTAAMNAYNGTGPA